MAFHNINHLSPYIHQQHLPAPPQPSTTCIMLPPFRTVSPVQHSSGLTLSDCSELSVSSRDETNFVAHRYPAPSVSLANHSNLTESFQLLHSPTTHSSLAVMPAPPSPRKASPSTALSTRSKIAKAPEKIARARSKLSSKALLHLSSNHLSAPHTPYKPTTPKKVRSSKSNIPGESRYWTPSEHKLFVEALLKYGPKDLKAISAYVGTRNMIQCRTHEQKCFMRLMREAQRETFERNGEQFHDLTPSARPEHRRKQQKDVYSVPSSCGITLLCVVSEEMTRSLQS